MRSSPWWYRRRSLVLLVVYFVAFYAGYALTALYARPVPSIVLIAHALHVEVRALFWVATAVSFAGFFLRLWGSAYLTAGIVWNPDALQGALLVDGPFRYMRNPLYVGNILLAIAIGSLAPPIGWAIAVAGNAWFTSMLAAHEADGMRRTYGEVYQRYREAVPAFFPRLRPASVTGSVRGNPSWIAGLKAEALMLAFALGMIVLTLTFDWRIFWAIVIVGWLAQYVLRYQTPRGRAQLF